MSETEEYKNELKNNRMRFNQSYANYVAGTQLISLFPMLGILGTVIGLAFGGSFNEINQLISGLHVALHTTIAGLICAIVLKIIDSILLGKMVNNIEASFEAADAAINSGQLRSFIEQAFHEHVHEVMRKK